MVGPGGCGEAACRKSSYRLGVIVASDKGAAGERQDGSSQVIEELAGFLGTIAERMVIPDDEEMISNELKRMADESSVDLIFTTGGTGLSPRDVTPEATLKVIDRLAPGFTEVMRSEGLKKTPHAMLSRAVAGIRGRTLIINLPGSPRAVKENLNVILPALPHALEIVTGHGGECGAGA